LAVAWTRTSPNWTQESPTLEWESRAEVSGLLGFYSAPSYFGWAHNPKVVG